MLHRYYASHSRKIITASDSTAESDLKPEISFEFAEDIDLITIVDYCDEIKEEMECRGRQEQLDLE